MQLEVSDGGRGFVKHGVAPKITVNVGVGLSGMRVRVEQLKGTLDIVSDSSGTAVTAAIPLSTMASSP